MKIIFWVAGILIAIWACTPQKGIIRVNSLDGEKTETEDDSITYELETFDTKFETWYLLHKSPANYRSQSYYENWNRQYVTAWNLNAMDPRKSWFFEMVIGYDPTVDYGFDLNHELFYYFQYVEKVLKIQIMSNGPNVVNL